MNILKIYGLPNCSSCEFLKREFPDIEYQTATYEDARKYGSMSVPFLVVLDEEGELIEVVIQNIEKIRKKINDNK